MRRSGVAVVSACLIALSAVTAQAERIRRIVAYDDVRIEVIAEGSGPLVVLLPGRGRGSEDFDEVAAGLAKAGFRVLRPQPRGAGQSKGPMKACRCMILRATTLRSSGTKVVVPRSWSDTLSVAGSRA